jgi:hypothetical protein
MCLHHAFPGAGRLPRRRLFALLAALAASTLARARNDARARPGAGQV